MGEPLQTSTDELRRIDFSGTLWLSSAMVANAAFVAALVVRHWTPAALAGGPAVLWWFGVVLVVLAMGALAWSGCPVLRERVESADRSKAMTIRLGILGYLVGAAVLVGAVLL